MLSVAAQEGAHEQTAADFVHATLQERLGISSEIAADLGTIEVACPVPGEGRRQSLADFMASPHGAAMAEQIITIAAEAREEGAEPEKAIQRALGFSAIVDPETKKLARVLTAGPAAVQLKKN